MMTQSTLLVFADCRPVCDAIKMFLPEGRKILAPMARPKQAAIRSFRNIYWRVAHRPAIARFPNDGRCLANGSLQFRLDTPADRK
jgi:hypothetical protein